ncbi:hypothetical protein BAY59_27175 [Prauserella coralliicola]|nr:hypothetical protein BAY59_27175 [Prauserella coralliicola]
MLITLGAFFSFTSPYFLTVQNLVNIVDSLAVVGIIAAPVTLLMISGKFDLSVGSSLAFTTAVLAVVITSTGNLLLGLAAALVSSLSVGLLNAFFVSVLRVSSLVTTLGVLAIFGGLAQVITAGRSIPVTDLAAFASARLPGGIPLSVVLLVAGMLLAHIVLGSTVFGRNQYAIGANPHAARLNGIRIGTATTLTYLSVGFGVFIASVVFLSQVRGYEPGGGSGIELAVLTAIVLGGISLDGGRGRISGTVLGLLIVGVTTNGLVLLNIGSFWQGVAQGTLLILAVTFDQSRRLLRKTR